MNPPLDSITVAIAWFAIPLVIGWVFTIAMAVNMVQNKLASRKYNKELTKQILDLL